MAQQKEVAAFIQSMLRANIPVKDVYDRMKDLVLAFRLFCRFHNRLRDLEKDSRSGLTSSIQPSSAASAAVASPPQQEMTRSRSTSNTSIPVDPKHILALFDGKVAYKDGNEVTTVITKLLQMRPVVDLEDVRIVGNHSLPSAVFIFRRGREVETHDGTFGSEYLLISRYIGMPPDIAPTVVYKILPEPAREEWEMRGFLLKLGSFVKNWKIRWFLINQQKLELEYFENKPDNPAASSNPFGSSSSSSSSSVPSSNTMKPKGAISLRDPSIVTSGISPEDPRPDKETENQTRFQGYCSLSLYYTYASPTHTHERAPTWFR